MINKFGKKQALVLSGILLMASAYAYISSSKNQETPVVEIKTVAAPYTNKISNFAPDTKMSVSYLTRNEKTPKDIYAVQYVLTSGDADYIDIELQINKRSQKINAALSGLPDTAKISLLSGKSRYHNNIPVDWAGRIELSTNNIDFKNESTICLEIEGLYQDKKPALCHNATGRQGQS